MLKGFIQTIKYTIFEFCHSANIKCKSTFILPRFLHMDRVRISTPFSVCLHHYVRVYLRVNFGNLVMLIDSWLWCFIISQIADMAF